MRGSTSFGVFGAVIACSLTWAPLVVNGHPSCFYDSRPTDPDEVLDFCPEAQDGACCNDAEEAGVEALFNAAGNLTPACADYHKQVVCGVCHSYSIHLYEILGPELGSDGMIMKNDFCDAYVAACAGEISFPDYDGVGYCNKHTGGSTDNYWSFPYVEPDDDPNDLVEYFPSKPGFPTNYISMHMSPDASVWWIAFKRGKLLEVSVNDFESSIIILHLDEKEEFYYALEEGLLDFAFGPAFHSNNRFYVSHSVEDAALDIHNRLSMFEFVVGDRAATLASEEVLVESSPKSTSIHSGGWCGFKPSDYTGSDNSHDLYWTIGDSGPQEDPDLHGQAASDLHGTIVRITVPTSGTGYTVPTDNYQGGISEICAIGFRNPWRCGFDRLTDELYCGDVGHTFIESIYSIECGKNYGWSKFEGSRCQTAREGDYGDCSTSSRAGFEFPIFEYCHPNYYADSSEDAYTDGVDICGPRTLTGSSVIGGYVYRGQYLADVLEGAYIFGDTQKKNIYFMKFVDGKWRVGTILSDSSVYITSFAEDAAGEMFLISHRRHIYSMPCGDLCDTTCLAQALSQPSYQLEGCYVDEDNDHPLTLSQAPDCAESNEGAMSPAICASYCATIPGAVSFGVAATSGEEASFECFCGSSSDNYNNYASLPDESCKTLCRAVPDQFCGGFDAVSIYTLGSPVPTPAPVTLEPIAPVTTTPTTPVPALPPQDTPAPVESASYTYLGCFFDSSSNRVLSGTFQKGMTSLTPDVCAEFCEGYTYFGTEFGSECFCGLASDDYEELGSSNKCTFDCAGDATIDCGGRNKISVYGFDAATPSPTPSEPTTPSPTIPPVVGTSMPVPTPAPVVKPYTYIDCFFDSKLDRVLSGIFVKKDETMTPDVCSTFCTGFPFFGTEFSNECFCGVAGDDYARLGTSNECTYDCAGDTSIDCGGKNKISVYSNLA